MIPSGEVLMSIAADSVYSAGQMAVGRALFVEGWKNWMITQNFCKVDQPIWKTYVVLENSVGIMDTSLVDWMPRS